MKDQSNRRERGSRIVFIKGTSIDTVSFSIWYELRFFLNVIHDTYAIAWNTEDAVSRRKDSSCLLRIWKEKVEKKGKDMQHVRKTKILRSKLLSKEEKRWNEKADDNNARVKVS